MNARAVTTAEESIVRGRVERVFYAAPDWSAGVLSTLSGGSISFSGKLYARVGDLVVLHGQWVHHHQYGRQFKVASMEYHMPLDKAGLAQYLAHHPDVQGIGPVKARILAEKFGHDFENALVERAEAMAQAARVPLATIHALRDLWLYNTSLNRISAWLARFELTHHQVSSLIRRLGCNAVGVLQDNPYLLVGEAPGFGFKRVDKIACKMGIPKRHPGRIRAGVIESVENALDLGYCWLRYDELVSDANELLAMDEMESDEWIRDAIKSLVNENLLINLHSEDFVTDVVAKPAIWEMEKSLAETFARNRPSVLFSREDAEWLVRRFGGELNEGQSRAALNALTNMISLITGGAGSGKTFTIKTILDICNARKFRVYLAAPTGKAAKRMEQVTGQRASTIHRLLGYNGREYQHGPDHPLWADVIIVDEMSMVDVPLAWRLFQSLDLEKTAVIMVGDHNQLPPVGPGNVLRDLVQRGIVPTVILDEIVRQAGVLKENSIAILGGKVPKSSERDASGRRAWHLFDDFNDPDDIPPFICDMYRQVLAQKCGYDLVNDVQVLTPTHKGPLGTRALNIMLQRLLQKMLYDVNVPPALGDRPPRILLHDKVIQTRNNYDLDVMNGAVGIVKHAPSDGSLAIDFDGTVVTLPAKSSWLKDIQLAYCLSIHKGQGSEYPCVIAIVHKAHSFQHHRNLFYTAVTRARETAIILGDHWGIRDCARKRKVDMRQTFLSLWPDVAELQVWSKPND
jgi:exodeoxyribonuclease V alpha subunit